MFLAKPFSVFDFVFVFVLNPFYPSSLFVNFTSYLAPPVMSYKCNVALNGVETSLWNHQILLGTFQLCCQSMRRLFINTIAGIAKVSLIFQPFTSVIFSTSSVFKVHNILQLLNHQVILYSTSYDILVVADLPSGTESKRDAINKF